LEIITPKAGSTAGTGSVAWTIVRLLGWATKVMITAERRLATCIIHPMTAAAEAGD
jgi:hypothetical protein